MWSKALCNGTLCQIVSSFKPCFKDLKKGSNLLRKKVQKTDFKVLENLINMPFKACGICLADLSVI